MNLLPLIFGAVVLAVAASKQKPKAVATNGSGTAKTTSGGGSTPAPTKPKPSGGGSKPKPPVDDGSDATFVSPSTPCDFVMLRTVDDISFQPTGPTKIQLGPFAYGDKAVVVAEATAKAKSTPDPYPGSPPGTWTLLVQCEGGFSENIVLGTFS